MGIEDYLLTSTVIGILAQRLVRTLCVLCREEYPALPELVEQMHLRKFVPEGPITLWHARGCPACQQTGYIGRVSILEMLPMTDALRSLVMRHATATELRAQALAEGMVSMYDDGLRKAVKGVTTFEEILRVTRES
jgi:general secretion pathway protein E